MDVKTSIKSEEHYGEWTKKSQEDYKKWADLSEENYIEWVLKSEQGICISKFKGSKAVLPHKHDFIELVLIVSGSCSHKYNGKEVPVVLGDIFVVLPDEEHCYEITKETVIYNCLFYPKALGEDWTELKNVGGSFNFIMVEPAFRLCTEEQQVLHLNTDDLVFIRDIFDRMHEEQFKEYAAKDIALKAWLMIILVHLGRVWDRQFQKDRELLGDSKKEIYEAIKYIEEHLEQELCIEKIAQKAFLSSNHFRRTFKQVTGLTPVQYINKLRVTKAMKYLNIGQHNITEIANKVGIDDANYFARLFKKTTGITPKDYIKKH
ncbi:MAG: AraC family transcriptional regulator [Clostridia bacterium]|jgi:AraC family L-rhamnose operon regulatory protein RhaS|nr:AraC family transcriptional regulator [Clostridia bacterium]